VLRVGGGVLAVALGTAGLGGAVLASGAEAQVYPPAENCGVQLSASSVGPGGAITISGSQAPPGATLTIVFESDPVVIATTTADASGRFTVQATIPANATPGRHTIRVEGATGCSAEVFVPGPSAAAGPARARPSGSLAFTGWSALTYAVIGLISLTVGLLLVAADRRARTYKRPHAAPAVVWRPRD
jgi:hyaluronoglucosaminidase